MDSRYTYLLINFLTIFFPVVLSFDKRVQFYRNWKFLVPALIITGGFFLLWDYVFTVYKVWSFNREYITGFYILNLPFEEVLFFITVPFACVFIYECLNYYIRNDILKPIGRLLGLLLIVLAIGALFLFYSHIYTAVTFSLLLLLVVFAQYIMRVRWLSRFYLAYIVSLLPFYLVNGLLTSMPVVLYNDRENLGLRVGTIPFEDHFYSMAMFLMNVILYEYFKKRRLDHE